MFFCLWEGFLKDSKIEKRIYKGKFRVKRETSKKKYRQKLREFKIWIKQQRNEKVYKRKK